MRHPAFAFALLCGLPACSSTPAPDAGVPALADAGPPADGASVDARTDGGRRVARCAPDSPHDPYRYVTSSEFSEVRGWQVRRGVLHVHTIYSHDACDEKGFVDDAGVQDYVNGRPNLQCLADLREGICKTQQDFVQLTDHRDHYPDFEYRDLLLYDAAAGDVLLEAGGAPYANRMRCPDGHTTLLTTGVDYDVLGLGIDRHVAPTPADRRVVYQRTPAAFDALRASGGIVICGYMPRWNDPDDIWRLPFDGIEVYNPVFNLTAQAGTILTYLTQSVRRPDQYAVPEVSLMLGFEETEETLRRWAAAVQKRRLPSVLGSNAHRNVFVAPTSDGERLDSYRRILHWFSNYVRVRPGETLTPDLVEQRIREGNTYAVFDFLGYADGFDYHATVGTETFEMGSEIVGGAGTVLRATAPRVQGLGTTGRAPSIRVRIVRARDNCPLTPPATGDDHCWEEIVSSATEAVITAPTRGVYRAEARIIPQHLRQCLGATPDDAMREVLWVYGNAIYVDMAYSPMPLSAPFPDGLMCGDTPGSDHHDCP